MRWVCLMLLGVCSVPLIAAETAVDVPVVRVENVFGEESPWVEVIELEGRTTIVKKDAREPYRVHSMLIATDLVNSAAYHSAYYVLPSDGALLLDSVWRPLYPRSSLPPGE